MFGFRDVIAKRLHSDKNIINYADLREGRNIVHFVGGKLTDDFVENLDDFAYWILDNDITILWGDEYQEKANPNHPVALLIKRVNEKAKERGIKPNTPIRILQIGEAFDELKSVYESENVLLLSNIDAENLGSTKRVNLNNEVQARTMLPAPQSFFDKELERCVAKTPKEKVYDLVPVYIDGALIGFYDKLVKDEIAIYTKQQQDRQKLYYNNSNGLFVLPGGVGCGSEIVASLIYILGSKDLPKWFNINVIDDDEARYEAFIDAYAGLVGSAPEVVKVLKRGYYPSLFKFLENNFVDGVDDNL